SPPDASYSATCLRTHPTGLGAYSPSSGIAPPSPAPAPARRGPAAVEITPGRSEASLPPRAARRQSGHCAVVAPGAPGDILTYRRPRPYHPPSGQVRQTGLIYRTVLMYCRAMTAAPPRQPANAPPPPFLRLAAHPLRWQLLRELARSDRQVRELTTAVAASQNLVSYHLARLRAGRLVSMRRSSADARDAYYRIDLARCRDLLAAAGGALHPGLALAPPAPAGAAAPSRRRPRVLFLCTGNSTRSQLAEALLRRLAAGSVDVHSAGSHP